MTTPKAVSLARDDEASPLEGFVHDLDFTRFDTRLGRLIPLVLGTAVAVVAVNLGAVAAWTLTVAIGAGLVVVLVIREGDRWRAQDVLHWFYAGRRRRWLEDTGQTNPSSEAAAAEVWLGVHQPGTVPQIYRAIAAGWTGDPQRFARELAAMPSATSVERAMKQWVVEAKTWAATGEADTTEIQSIVETLPDSDERSTLQSWLALVESGRRWARHERGWIGPVVAQRAHARREPLGLRHRARLWLSRFVVVPAFLLASFFIVSLALTVADPARQVPQAYAQTSIFTRGDVPEYDANRVWLALPRIATALSKATRADPLELGEDGIDLVLDRGLPTFIWETGAIDVAGPGDAVGRRVWSVEVLLGEDGPSADRHAIVTYDREGGPAWLYRIDGSLAPVLRQALGLSAAAP